VTIAVLEVNSHWGDGGHTDMEDLNLHNKNVRGPVDYIDHDQHMNLSVPLSEFHFDSTGKD